MRHRDADVVSVDGLLRAAARRWPQQTAVESPTAALTYAELDGAVNAAVSSLRACGVDPGDRVAFALAHDLALYAVPFVCARAGVTGLLLNTALPPAAWAGQLALAGPALLVADEAHAQRLAAAAAGGPVTPATVALALDGAGPEGHQAPCPPDPDRPVALLATSGSTGEPTVVRLSSRGLLHVGRAYLELLDLGPGERSLVVMPLFHVAALSTQSVTMPMVGGCNVLPELTRPEGALRRMAERRITLLDAAPAWLTMVTRESPAEVPTWRTLVYGGAPMPSSTVHRLATDHPGVAMYDVWGLSEAHGPVTAQRYDPARPAPAGTVGQPLAGLRVRAWDAGPLPPGQTGELCVAGPTVHAGTLDHPGGDLREGWLHTGDLGSVAADGTVRITGRAKELILRGGLPISVREVEQALCAAEGVVDAAASAVDDGLGGEAVAAVVVAGPNGPGDEVLRRLIAERLGTHAVPRRIVRVDALPRTASGKVDRPALRAVLG